jgi:tetratricopeptide (TPR) repeat protein
MSSEIHGPTSAPPDSAGGRRLDSWKEIAAFFQRDTRTVRRWEQTRHLPVHRVPGRRGYVFAYVDEMNQWLRSADALAAEEDAAVDLADSEEIREVEPEGHLGETEVRALPGEVAAGPGAMPSSLPRSGPQSGPQSRVPFAIIAGAVLLIIIAVIAEAKRVHRQRSAVSGSLVSASDVNESVKYTLRGRYYWDRRTEGGLQEALDSFTQAVVHDNNNAKAYAGLAETYDLLPEYGKMSNAVAYPRAIAAADRAIALDPSLAEAHRALGFALFYWNWDVNRALSEFHLALQLDPQDFESHHWLATSLLTLGRGPESVAQIQRARELQPSSRSILADQALINLCFHHDPAESIATLRELERTDPDFVVAPRYLASIFADQRDYGDFITEENRAAEIAHDANLAAVMKGASDGWRKGGAHDMLLNMKAIQEQLYAKGSLAPFDLARTCLWLGDKACTLHYLEAAYAAHDYLMLTTLGGGFDDLLKDEPEFRQLQAEVRKRMNQSA